MSLRTRINGFTAWVNLRLTPYNQLLNNVLMDLLSGTHMKYFVESFTGRDLKRLENMDGLTDQQKQTRIDWVIEELKKCNVIPEDVYIDSRSFAMRSSEHVFDLLWRLISHDIWFVWERAEYLQVMDYDVLTQVPFKWTPDPPPRKKKSKKQKKQSLLSGFGASSSVSDDKHDDHGAMESAKSGVSDWLSGSNNPGQTRTETQTTINSDHMAYTDHETENISYNILQATLYNKTIKKQAEQRNMRCKQKGIESKQMVEESTKSIARGSTVSMSRTQERQRSSIPNEEMTLGMQQEQRSSDLVSIYIVPLKDEDDQSESSGKLHASSRPSSVSSWQPEQQDQPETAQPWWLASANESFARCDSEPSLPTYVSETVTKMNLLSRGETMNARVRGQGHDWSEVRGDVTMATREASETNSLSSLAGGGSALLGLSSLEITGAVQTLPARLGEQRQFLQNSETPGGKERMIRNLSVPDLREYEEKGIEISEALRSSLDLHQTLPDDDGKWIKFPNAEYMKGFKKKKRKDGEEYPNPDECVLEMVNFQLKTTRDGKGLYCYSIDDFVDSRVLCALVNSFVPNTFTADLLLNDRWTINLALKTVEKMFYAETPFAAEDLVEGDPMAVCAYFAFFLMCAYRYRQTVAVIDRVDFINMLIREGNHDLEKFPQMVANLQELQRRKDLKQQLDKHRQALENLQKKYDVEFCKKWVQHVEHVQNELRRDIREKMRQRFEIVEVPRNITINDFCLAAVINLSLTNGSGFFNSSNKETLSDGRKLVLQNKETLEFIEDFTNRSKLSIKDALHLPDMPGQVLEISPQDHQDFYEFYFEAQSRNKQLKAGSQFLYQVFPGNTIQWQRLFIKSAREAEYETVEKMIMFFRDDTTFINCREPKSGNTALHWACRMGNFDVVRLLLENGANIDIKNNFKCTPLNLAIEALQRKICHYLIEWGCDVHSKNVKGQSVLETIKNDDFKRYLMDIYDYYSSVVPRIMAGDMDLLDKVILDHVRGVREFCCLRSRCVNGSTLLHTACYYGHIPAIKELLAQRVDVNLRDYKGATPLHRAKNPDIMEILLEAGAHVNAEDSESNTPLHVKCYGETGQASELECITMLLNKNASLVIRNSKGLLPIHCCAMQGRIDLMQLMNSQDKENTITTYLNKEDQKKPPSLLHLAVANDFIECAEWLMASGFGFKEKEPDILMRRILTEQIKLNKRADAVRFLLENGADSNPKYPAGNTALHYSAGLSGPSDVLELLISYKADVDVINDEGCTPLFFATQANNKFAACVLIEHGSNVRQKNSQGLTAFDYIVDFEEWIDCGYFTEEIKARLKAFNLKHARDLIRAISKKVKPGQMMYRGEPPRTHYGPQTPGLNPQFRVPSSPIGGRLPPLVPASRGSQRYLMC